MAKYIVRRIVLSILTFFCITIIVFFISYLAPGSSLDYILANSNMSPEEIELRASQLGLNQPVYKQYLTWLKEFFKGNLGISLREYRSVTEMIGERFGNTLLLTFSSLLIAYFIAIPIGIHSSRKPYSIGDFFSATAALVSMALPGFFIGMFMIWIFSAKLGWLPMGGMYSSSAEHSIIDLLKHMAMPVTCLALQQLGNVMRQMRSSMLEVLSEDYVRTARATGLSEIKTVYIHALRNAMGTIVTLFGTSLPFLVGGAVVTEQVFSWPGIGSLMVTSITTRDHPVIIGITVVVATTVLLGNLLVDITYGILDPKVKYD